jgi:hypothetical protein
MHVLPEAQAGQALPPQSTPVSLPFLTPSTHEEATRHWPLTHELPAGQTWPHAPQLAESVLVSRQDPPQFTWSAGHAKAHTPPEQIPL